MSFVKELTKLGSSTDARKWYKTLAEPPSFEGEIRQNFDATLKSIPRRRFGAKPLIENVRWNFDHYSNQQKKIPDNLITLFFRV